MGSLKRALYAVADVEHIIIFTFHFELLHLHHSMLTTLTRLWALGFVL
jgi:hypothetical protein